MNSCYQRSVKSVDQAVQQGVIFSVSLFFVCNFIWYCMHLHWCRLKNLMLEFYKTIVSRLKLLLYIKGTLMQIWQFPTMFVFTWKQHPENFAFLILRISRWFPHEVCKCLKMYANFYLAHTSKRERFVNVKSST